MSAPEPDGMAGVAGYTIALPREWRRLPVREGSDRAVDRALDDVFAGVGRDQVAQLRHELRDLLRGQLAEARRVGGLDFFIPLRPIGGRQVAASMIVSLIEPRSAPEPGAGRRPEAAIITELLADNPTGATQVLLGGVPAVRSQRDVAAASPADAATTPGVDLLQRATRRVTYLAWAPDDSGWFCVSFSTAVLREEDDPVVNDEGLRFDDLLVRLFDAIVGTLRWTRDGRIQPLRATPAMP